MFPFDQVVCHGDPIAALAELMQSVEIDWNPLEAAPTFNNLFTDDVHVKFVKDLSGGRVIQYGTQTDL